MQMTVLGAEGAPAPEPAGEEPRGPSRPWDGPQLRRRLLIAAALAWAVALTAVVLVRGGGGEKAASPAVAPSASPSASQGPLSVADVYQTLLPSVVQIEATGSGADKTSSGTGVIVNANGTILTALHVVDGAGA